MRTIEELREVVDLVKRVGWEKAEKEITIPQIEVLDETFDKFEEGLEMISELVDLWALSNTRAS